LTTFGSHCQYTTLYAKIVVCGLLFLSLTGLFFSVRLMIVKFGRRFLTFNAFSTTLLQIILSFLAASTGNALKVYRIFVPSSRNSVLMNAFHYFQFATLIHGIGAALNISLLWIEIAAFKEMRILKNITRMKYVLLTTIASLYLAWISFGLILNNYRIVQIVADCFIIFLVLSFGMGAWQLSRLLQQTLPHSITDARRKQANDAEKQIIFSNSKGVIALGTLYLVFPLFYLQTYKLRSSYLSFFSFMACLFSFEGINYIVLWHLKGEALFSSKIVRFRKQKVKIYAKANPTGIPRSEPPSEAEVEKSPNDEIEKYSNSALQSTSK